MSRKRMNPGLSLPLALIAVASILILRPFFEPRRPSLVQQISALTAVDDWRSLADLLDRSLVSIPAGAFLRGSDTNHLDERPARLVTLDAFAIDRFEVTNAQYRRFMLAASGEAPPYWHRDEYPAGQADYPVTGITWDDASNYCHWAGKRLPTEAEWEKACRGTDGRVYPWGDSWDVRRANLDPLAGSFARQAVRGGTIDWEEAWGLLRVAASGPGSRGLRPVGSYPAGASPYGVLDMAGNASEWVADWYAFRDYSSLPERNPQTTGPQWNHALRGSAWYDPNGGTDWSQDQSRCAARNSSHDVRDPRVGFRCAVSDE